MAYRIPLFDLALGPREYDAVHEPLRDRWISMGSRTEAFERAFGEIIGSDRCVAVTNGTAALHLALVALGIGPGDEVIVPSLTFVATVAAVRYVGAIPVFADISDIADPNLSADEVESLVTPRTRAVLIVHYGGFPCDLDRLCEITRRRGIALVEDAAHAPGSRHRGVALGTFGDIGCFSFFSNKNVTTAEGGMVVAASAAHYDRIKRLRSHGMTSMSYDRARGHSTDYDVLEIGYNYRLDDIRAALGLAQLERLADDRSRRQELRRRYVGRLSALAEVAIPFRETSGDVSNYIMPIVLKPECALRRDEFRQALAREGIQTSVHYPAVHEFSAFADYARPLARTEYYARRTVTLPLYRDLRDAQVDEICDVIAAVLERARRDGGSVYA